MTVTHREDLPGRQVKLTIAIDTESWHKALADAYRENHAYFPVDHCPRKQGEVQFNSRCLDVPLKTLDKRCYLI